MVFVLLLVQPKCRRKDPSDHTGQVCRYQRYFALHKAGCEFVRKFLADYGFDLEGADEFFHTTGCIRGVVVCDDAMILKHRGRRCHLIN